MLIRMNYYVYYVLALELGRLDFDPLPKQYRVFKH